MSYCIEYTSTVNKKYPIKTKSKQIKIPAPLLIVAAVVALLLIPGVRDVLKQLLLPGDPVVTETAFVSMLDKVGAGESFYDAVTVFCKEIIQGAAA